MKKRNTSSVSAGFLPSSKVMPILRMLPLFLLFYTLHSTRNCFQFPCANIIFRSLSSMSFTYNSSSLSQFSLSFPFFSLLISIQYSFAFLLSPSSLVPFFFYCFVSPSFFSNPFQTPHLRLLPPTLTASPILNPHILLKYPFFLDILSLSRTNAAKYRRFPLPHCPVYVFFFAASSNWIGDERRG